LGTILGVITLFKPISLGFSWLLSCFCKPLRLNVAYCGPEIFVHAILVALELANKSLLLGDLGLFLLLFYVRQLLP